MDSLANKRRIDQRHYDLHWQLLSLAQAENLSLFYDGQELLERGGGVAVPGWAARAEGLITEAPRGFKYTISKTQSNAKHISPKYQILNLKYRGLLLPCQLCLSSES